jgi:hypothetical protein
MRRPFLLILATAASAALLAGCGAGSDAGTPLRSVRLSVAQPGDADVVRGERVAVIGRVDPPGAVVTVRGQRAALRDGRFRADVALDPGTNVVDVLASAPGRRPAMTALRVGRQVTVTIPSLAGSLPGEAADRLATLGLDAEQDRRGGVVELLLPGDAVVCGTDPPAGRRVDPGAVVRLVVSKRC